MMKITFKKETNVSHTNENWIYHLLAIYVNGIEAGYIRIAYIPKEWFDQRFPSILNWISQMKGVQLFPLDKQSSKIEDLSDDNLKHIIKNAYWAFFSSEYDIHIQESRKQLLIRIREILKFAIKKYSKSFHEFKEYHIDKPEPDYIRVHDDFRGMGIGKKLYIEASRWMNEMSLQLYSSTTQTLTARKAWGVLVKLGLAQPCGNRYVMIPLLSEDASAGGTSAGNVATMAGGLWCGPTKGEYPYVEPDYAAAGLQKIPLRLGMSGATIADKPKKRKAKKKKKK